jgi:hypothetical protein
MFKSALALAATFTALSAAAPDGRARLPDDTGCGIRASRIEIVASGTLVRITVRRGDLAFFDALLVTPILS